MDRSKISDTSRYALVGRLAGFSSLPLLSLLTPFLLLPILARTSTREVWSSIAIGQSIGGLSALVISFGWTLRGPAIVAQAGPKQRAGLYVESLLARLLMLVLIMPVVALIVALLTPSEGRVIGISMAAAVAISGLSAAWFNIGEGRVSDIAVYDAAPRMIATALSAAGLVVFHEAVIYPVLIGLFAIFGVVLFTRRICPVDFFTLARGVNLRTSFRSAAPSALTVVAAGAYSTSAVALVGAGAPTSSQSLYVSGDKIYGMGLYAVIALANALQAWVAEVEGVRAWGRMRAALLAHGLLGVAGALFLGFYGPTITRILYGHGLETPRNTMIWMGLSFFFVSASTAVGRLVLIPLREDRAVLVSTLVGAAVGVPLLVAAAAVAGSEGGAFGLAASQFVVLTVQIAALWRYRSRQIPRIS